MKTSGLAVFTTKETEAQRGSDLDYTANVSRTETKSQFQESPSVSVTGPGLVSFCWKDTPDRVSQAALSAPDPQCLGSSRGVWGEVLCGYLGVAVSGGSRDWAKGCFARRNTARKSTHSSLWPQPGAESHVRGYHGEARTGTQGESESGMGVGRSPFIHCFQLLPSWEGGGRGSLQDAEAGLCGGHQGSVGAISLLPWLGILCRGRTPLLGDCLVVPEACFLSGCCKVIK